MSLAQIPPFHPRFVKPEIYFWKAEEIPFGFLSNFFPLNNSCSLFKSVEHYYQASKFDDQEYQIEILNTSSPYKAKLLGNQEIGLGFQAPWRIELNEIIKKAQKRGIYLRSDWEYIKINMMLSAIREKFNKDVRLKGLLLGTGHARLIENSPYDSFWGIGKDGKGKNQLGLLLMQVREEIRRTTIAIITTESTKV